MIDYLKMMRVHHYIKNLLVLAALVFSGQLLDTGRLISGVTGFLVFCFVSSAVYIFNDIKDREKDRNHPVKKDRPIASGRVSVRSAAVVAVICIVLAAALSAFRFDLVACALVLVYVLINIAYSAGLKNVPLLDVAILVSGFLIRIIYGAVLTEIPVSNWLYLTVISISFFFAFGKRRNEIKMAGDADTRAVLKGYTEGFLDKSMYMCLTLANVFYALWSVGDSTAEHYHSNIIVFTVQVVLLITLKYCMNVESETSDGDPVEVLLHDKILILLCAVYAVSMMLILYSGRI